jgi:hypothetical protein
VARVVGVVISSIAATLAAVFLLLPIAVRGLVRVLDLTLNACVWLAASLSNGTDGWTIFAEIGRTAGGMLLSTRAITVLSGLVLVVAAALYCLQRLLGSEEESWR